MSIMTMLYDQDTVTKNHENAIAMEAKDEGRKEGRKEGMQEGILNVIKKLYKEGKITLDEALQNVNMTKKEFLALN